MDAFLRHLPEKTVSAILNERMTQRRFCLISHEIKSQPGVTPKVPSTTIKTSVRYDILTVAIKILWVPGGEAGENRHY